jgi:spore maturation protein CgeB
VNCAVLVIGDMNLGALAESYARGFERIGLEVFRFDTEAALYRSTCLARNRLTRRLTRRLGWTRLNREVTETVYAIRPELIFAVKASFLDPETIRSIRRDITGSFVNCYPDNPYIGVRLDPRETSALRHDLIDVLREYSAVLMWERGLRARLVNDGVQAEYLPFGVDPELCRASAAAENLQCRFCARQHRVVFVGTNSRARRAEISKIRRHPAGIWGSNWPTRWKPPSADHRVHRAVWGKSPGQIYAQAAVSLNILNAESLDGHNMRTFEIPANGGVMLSRFTSAQNELFPEGEAALYYRSPEEIDDLLDSILDNRKLRDRVRDAAVRIANDHSYEMRAATVWNCFRDTRRRLIA